MNFHSDHLPGWFPLSNEPEGGDGKAPRLVTAGDRAGGYPKFFPMGRILARNLSVGVDFCCGKAAEFEGAIANRPRKPCEAAKQESFIGCRRSIMWAVAKPFILPARARKRGNPNWGSGRPSQVQPRMPTAFEEQVQKLRLNEQTCATSEKLKQWCERNKDRCFVPEWLLKRWRMSVDPNFSG